MQTRAASIAFEAAFKYGTNITKEGLFTASLLMDCAGYSGDYMAPDNLIITQLFMGT